MKYKDVLIKVADAYTDALNDAKANSPSKLDGISPGEIGWGLAGAGGGAAIGYMLSQLLHRKPSTRQKLLYSLLGAAAGGAGSQYALAHLPGTDGFDGSKRDEMRISNSMDSEPSRAPEPGPSASGKPAWLTARNVGLASALVGAARGARLGSHRGSLGAFNAYEELLYRLHRDRATLESQLNGGIQAAPPSINKSTVLNAGRWHGYTVEDAGGQTLRLLDPERNLLRGSVNALLNGALHGAAGYGIGKLVDKYSQNIDAGNAAVSKDELLARVGK